MAKGKEEREDGKPVSKEDLKKSEEMCKKCRKSVHDCSCKD
jgi:hypothetical protein